MPVVPVGAGVGGGEGPAPGIWTAPTVPPSTPAAAAYVPEPGEKDLQDGRNLLEQFRALAPERPPIPIQRWSTRRVGVTIGTLLLALLLLTIVAGNWRAFA